MNCLQHLHELSLYLFLLYTYIYLDTQEVSLWHLRIKFKECVSKDINP